jgi:hypothetical protein
MDSRGLLPVVAEAKVFGRHVLGCSAAEEDLRYLGRSSRVTFNTLSKSQWWPSGLFVCGTASLFVAVKEHTIHVIIHIFYHD